MVEDHFARLNTALTRGKAQVRVAVVHPVESYWLSYGPSENTSETRIQLENDFNNVIDWLLKGCIDFDFISESLIPELYKGSQNAQITLGEMKYRAIVVPPILTIRSTTLGLMIFLFR